MTDIKFGMSFHDTYDYDPEGVVRHARMVEELGFDSLWITENVNSGAPALEVLVGLATFAAHTERVTIGSAVILLPLRNPIALAHTTATLDRLSGGRLILGIGAGNPMEEVFGAYGVSTSKRGRRCDEYLEIIIRLWTGEPVSYQGRYHQFNDYVLGARPQQRPHPPIWIGGKADAVLRRTARFGDGFLPHSTGPRVYAGLLDGIDRYSEELDRDPSKITKAVQLYFSMGESRAQARATADQTLSIRYLRKVTLPDGDENRYAIGTADDCARAIEAYIEVGATHFVFSAALPVAQVPGQVERLATQVISRFR